MLAILVAQIVYAVPTDFDCAMRKLSAQYAAKLIPSSSRVAFDAFELGAMCGEPAPPPFHPTHAAAVRHKAGATFHVHPRDGVDGAAGSLTAPLRTIARGVARCRAWRRALASNDAVRSCDVLLANDETFHLAETLHLGAADSYTRIAASTPFVRGDPRAKPPVLSGGVDITADLTWTPAGAPFPSGVVKSVVTGDAAQLDFTQLFVDAERVVRARHPNASPGGYYRTGLWNTNSTGWFPRARGWTRSATKVASSTVFKTVRPTSRYSNFTLGYGGPVSEFVPPAAYWAVEKPPAGGGCKYEVPSAVEFSDGDFSDSGAIPPSQWANGSARGALVHAFHHAYWGDWSFEVENKTCSVMHFARGGFQEARGSCGKGGHDWCVGARADRSRIWW